MKTIVKAAGGIVAGAAVVLAAITPAHAENLSKTTRFATACVQWGTWGNTNLTINQSIEASAPATVETGKEFTFRVTHAGIPFPNTSAQASRLKLDYTIPTGGEFVKAELVPGTGSNLGGKAASVLRVNDAGTPSATGNILRVSGDNEATGNSPKSSNNSVGGLTVADMSKPFTFPTMEVTMRAGAVGQTISPTIRTAGAAATYGRTYENYLTWYQPIGGVTIGNVAMFCLPKDGTNPSSSVPLNGGAGPLVTTKVIAPAVDSTTELNLDAEVKTGNDVELTANVDPARTGGTIQFYSDDQPIGDAIPVVDGVAKYTHVFDDKGEHKVTAKFSGSEELKPSTSNTKDVTVTNFGVDVDDSPEPTTPTTTPPSGGGSLGSIFGS